MFIYEHIFHLTIFQEGFSERRLFPTMTFQGKYCSVNTVPCRWQAGVFSLLIQNKDNFKPPLGSDIRADYFQQLMFCDFFFSLHEDAVAAFAVMRHGEASSDGATSTLLGNVKRWKELTCMITAQKYRHQGAMSFVIKSFIQGAGKCPIITYVYPDCTDVIGILNKFGFKKLSVMPDGRWCYVRWYA